MIRRRSAARITGLFLLQTCVCLPNTAVAKVDLLTIEASQKKAWVGQKASFSIKLRAKGPFVGAPSFSLPQIPKAVIVKVGDAVVSTEEIEDDSWFVQTHEFALFSQADGTVELPSFEVRFSNRESFTGPAVNHVETVPALKFQIERPPNSQDMGFLVTTDKIEIEETWEPQPADAKQGDVFHRTISQQADQVTGMALAPPPTKAPEGIRIYVDKPTVSDETERGDFTGKRSDTLTYLLEKPGTINIPAIKYVWWDPKSKKFGSKTLPGVTFHVAALPTVTKRDESGYSRIGWLLPLLPAIIGFAIAVWQRDQLLSLLRRFGHWLFPPSRTISCRLLRACRRNDTQNAAAAWLAWEQTQKPETRFSPDLLAEVAKLQRHRYGPASNIPWTGEELARTFRVSTARNKHASWPNRLDLAPLNPH